MEAQAGNAPSTQSTQANLHCPHWPHTHPAESSVWFLSRVIGFNTQTQGPYPTTSESEFHVEEFRGCHARVWTGQDPMVPVRVSCATCEFLLLLSLTLPWAWQRMARPETLLDPESDSF